MDENQHSGVSRCKPQVIALTGFMGAGKTCVGRSLAVILGWKFIDLDQEIELRQQLRVAEIFRQNGELRFRQIETETLQAMLARLSAATVIALGGGTFVSPGNGELLRQHGSQVVFLDAPVDQLLQRCRVGCDNHNARPLAADPDGFRALHALRLPQYRTADLTVLTSGKSIQQLAEEIAGTLGLVIPPR